MSEEEKFYFMLPALVKDGLVEDDSIHYAMTSYPQEIASQAAITIVTDYTNRNNKLDTSTKKRVKTIMEYLAIALSLPMKHTRLMTTARNKYREWLENPSIFGAVPRQNKYLCRIIKQLSLPFAFREPVADNFKSSFNNLLNNILNDIKFFHTTSGSWFTKETWYTLLNVSIGIADAVLNYDFGQFLPKSDITKLRQKAVDNYFSILQLSGLKDDDVWKRFNEYCRKWTKHFDFIRVWGKSVTKLFVYFNIRIYKPKLETQQEPFQEGVYSPENPISDEMVGFIFHHFVYAVDHQRLIEEPAELLKEFAINMLAITETAQALGDVTSEFFIKRFPIIPFLKIFGVYLTFCPILSDNYDEPVSSFVTAIISLLSNFQIDNYDNPSINRLITYVLNRTTPEHMLPLAAFLNTGYKLYRHNNKILPYVSIKTLDMIMQLNPAKAQKIVNEDFYSPCTSLFISATEMMSRHPNIFEKYQPAFQFLWNNTNRNEVQFQLLCFGSNIDVDITEKIFLHFQETTFRQMTSDVQKIAFIAGLIYLLSARLRFEPRSTSEAICSKRLIPHITTCITKTDPSHLDNFDILACALLQLFITALEWGVNIFTDRENLKYLYEFVDFVKGSLKAYSKYKKLKKESSDNEKSERSERSDKSERSDSSKFSGSDQENKRLIKGNGRWVEHSKSFIRACYEDIMGRISLHYPNSELFTRRSNSVGELNEEYIAKKLGLTDYKINYFAVRHNTLISFVEKTDGTGPLFLLSRGTHGRCVFLVEENLRRGIQDPQLADVVKRAPLNKAEKLQNREPIINTVDDLKQSPTISDLEADDERIRSVYAKSFDEWLDISGLSYVPDFNQHQPYQRPRVADFISKMGLLTQPSVYDVTYFTSDETVRNSIEKLDQVEFTTVEPVLIKHVLPCDKSIEDTNVCKRMTPLMSQFLEQVGEPMQLSPECCSANDIFILNTPVPAVPMTRGHIIFMSSAMVNSDITAKKINQTETLVTIIFNETDFDLKIELEKSPKSLLLVIRPKGKGLYHVTQLQVPLEMYSPFCEEQCISAKTLAFNISVCIEQFVPIKENLFPNTVHQRNKILKELEEKCGKKVDPALVANTFH
ncbi:hypothetical protein TVAG_351390 [Trichomonas vaginalis G3]|uniref:Ral GTPase-activating protein subunit alpha/beta N-terminal domain-containing protein n=1 Tax=Trichomonas vaginalis (strain ATCC PRA-98 / G3) TaxID=412133 RepID=A2DZM3_TRIV3|nr:hypothetical protein TVAGG3_0260880 [Trichomonas vaginalis G3]EAY14091.1 hypothetical protein TVAG_351390 [Trichomonas vaginalis G3]KAI5525101.1 hypothetical protein TVAGG3_0260880 [Trichomonas vaginalis G3]|eukprot:XP_001326314.1 hypothetical protein [Trichomonas vaginalis G3]